MEAAELQIGTDNDRLIGDDPHRVRDVGTTLGCVPDEWVSG